MARDTNTGKADRPAGRNMAISTVVSPNRKIIKIKRNHAAISKKLICVIADITPLWRYICVVYPHIILTGLWCKRLHTPQFEA